MDTLDLSLYPHIFPPPGFVQIERVNQLSPVPVGGPQLCETIDIGRDPYEGWIRHVGLSASDWSVTTYTIVQGGAPLRDYTAKVQPFGAPETPAPVFIRLIPSVPLQLYVTATGPTSFRWALLGWYYVGKNREPLGGSPLVGGVFGGGS